MNKKTLIAELQKRNIKFTKVIFKRQSPHMKARYRPEYVTWEAWVYTDKSLKGYLITPEGLDPEVIESTFDSIKEV